MSEPEARVLVRVEHPPDALDRLEDLRLRVAGLCSLLAYLIFTRDGQEAFRAYQAASMPMRKQEADLTERLRHYLGVVVEMRKAG